MGVSKGQGHLIWTQQDGILNTNIPKNRKLTYLRIYISLCIYNYMYDTYIYIYVYTYVYTRVYTYIYIYIHLSCLGTMKHT